MARLAPCLSLALLAACSDTPVGRPCYAGADASVGTELILASPALECQSRMCLHYGAGTRDLCTADCDSNEDCDQVAESPCEGGFACIVPAVVGPFCCRKMCVCEDYLPPRDGGIPVPAACDPDDPINECCNLPGRSGTAACP